MHQKHGRPLPGNGVADSDTAYFNVFNPRLLH